MTSLFLQLLLPIALLTGPALPTSGGSSSSSADADSLSADGYVQSLSSWTLTPSSPARGRFWVNSGYGQISKQYGPDSELLDAGGVTPLPTSLSALAGGLGVTLPLPEGVDGTVQGASARVSGVMSVLNVHVGGAVDVLRRPSYTVALGADVGFSQQHFQAERMTFDVDGATVSIPALGVEDAPLAAVAAQMNLEIPASLPTDQTIESGFRAQSLTLFAGFEKQHLSARAGYQLDLGPDPNLLSERRENTDRQDALLLGVATRRAFGELVLFGGLDGYVTFEGLSHGLSYDAGDVYGLNAGIGYRLGITEVGAALTYRYRTEGTVLVVMGDQAFASGLAAGYHVGISPYVNVAPRGTSLSAFVKGGVQDEYRDYTLSITGENDFAPNVGATFGLVYGL